jgi:hypothetical protein
MAAERLPCGLAAEKVLDHNNVVCRGGIGEQTPRKEATKATAARRIAKGQSSQKVKSLIL